jgi:hypothetical protein
VTMEFTHPLTELGTSILPGGKGRPPLKTDNLATVCERLVWKMSEPQRIKLL